MKDYISAKVNGPFTNFFIKKCLLNNIYLKKIDYLDEYNIKIILLKKDYLYIKKNFKDYKVKKIRKYGFDYLRDIFKKNSLIIYAFFLGIILLYFLSNIILEVKVIHNNSELRNMVTLELKDLGIKRFTLKKDYKELTKIKNTMLTNYKDKIEWLEIENVGMMYVIRLEERIIKNISNDNKKCHIVAKKDAIILGIHSELGDTLTHLYNYVNKGDILISGSISFNNEVKNEVCASGRVYGEVWYQVDVSIPLNYEVRTKTNKKWYNLKYQNNLDNHKILKSKFKNYTEENKKLFSIMGTNFYLVTEYEEVVTKKKYTENEAAKVAEEKAVMSILKKLSEKESILSKKVLKKEVFNSTMNVEVFISVKELISEVSEY